MLFFKSKEKSIKPRDAILFLWNKMIILDDTRGELPSLLSDEPRPKWDELKLLNRFDEGVLYWITITSPFVEKYFGRESEEFKRYRKLRYKAPQLSARGYEFAIWSWKGEMIKMMDELITRIKSGIRYW